jgi:hypothetical protein
LWRQSAGLNACPHSLGILRQTTYRQEAPARGRLAPRRIDTSIRQHPPSLASLRSPFSPFSVRRPGCLSLGRPLGFAFTRLATGLPLSWISSLVSMRPRVPIDTFVAMIKRKMARSVYTRKQSTRWSYSLNDVEEAFSEVCEASAHVSAPGPARKPIGPGCEIIRIITTDPRAISVCADRHGPCSCWKESAI